MGAAVDPEADAARVQAFLAQCEAAFRQHPVWRGCQPEVLDQAAEVRRACVITQLMEARVGRHQCVQLGEVLRTSCA